MDYMNVTGDIDGLNNFLETIDCSIYKGSGAFEVRLSCLYKNVQQ